MTDWLNGHESLLRNFYRVAMLAIVGYLVFMAHAIKREIPSVYALEQHVSIMQKDVDKIERRVNKEEYDAQAMYRTVSPDVNLPGRGPFPAPSR